MAEEPDNLTLRLLRDIRAAQDLQRDALEGVKRQLELHGDTLQDVKSRLDDLYKISTHTLGVAANAHFRYEELEAKVDKLARRVDQLESAR